MTVSERYLERILRKIDPCWTLQNIEPLSSRASALHVSIGAETKRRLILLTHSRRDRDRNPQIAHDEYRLLEILNVAGLPVADALHLCEAHQPPFLITSYAEGSARFGDKPLPAIGQAFAAILHNIHAITLDRYDLSFLPQLQRGRLREVSPRTGQAFSEQDTVGNLVPTPAFSGNLRLAPATCAPAGDSERRRIQAAMQRAMPRVEFNAPALLHGDFWPGNVLWNDGRLSAIIDWEDAMLGDPLADLGKSRLEILWAHGFAAMEAYSARYLQLNSELNAAALPFWDLWGAMRLSHYASFAPEPEKIPQMRRQYEAFVATAIGRLEAL